jgi:orotidine-5'-phosphate decarboxylase
MTGPGSRTDGTDFEPGNRLIAAIDVDGRAEADRLVERLDGAASWVKVGLELFVATGPALVEDYFGRGLRVMLDLKLHDIPETVARATRRAAALGAGLLTVHTGGGRAMLEAAVAAAREAAALSGHRTGGPLRPRTRILGVTVLTSMDEADLAEVGAVGTVGELVARRARLAVAAGCDGVVASPLEAASLRQIVPDGFLIVTPGVRPTVTRPGGPTRADDQKRVTTPAAARAAGADLIVVGRPIRDAADPAAMARQIASELAADLTEQGEQR